MADHEKDELLKEIDEHFEDDPLKQASVEEMSDSGDEPLASSSDHVELHEVDAESSNGNGKKKKKKRIVKKKKKNVKRKPAADGVDQAPVNPDELVVEGDENGYRTYDTNFLLTIPISIVDRILIQRVFVVKLLNKAKISKHMHPL
jgi:hypothetical protein